MLYNSGAYLVICHFIKNCSGVYRDHLDQDLLPILLDAGLPFLLRWSLDDNTESLITASISCFTALLVRKQDEVLINTLCNCFYDSRDSKCSEWISGRTSLELIL